MERPGRTLKDRYLLDQTRPYHNLLGIEREGAIQTFYYDGNVAAMEDKETGMHYYLQDELGSSLRVSGYRKRAGAGNGTGNRAGNHAAPDYLTYGYDEFGNDLYRELEESGIPSPYDRQGEEQPFGYTGYRYDDISGTYFAQAREYQPENGRFTAEDVVKGNGAVPETLNRYGYCWGNPVGMVDNDGKIPVLGILLIASLPFILGGCGNTEEYDIPTVVVEPIEPTPSPTPGPAPTLSPTPFIEPNLELTEEEKIFVATICGEAIGEGELGWKVVANAIMNRIESKHWEECTVMSIIENTGFNAYTYKSNEYLKAMDYLNNRTFDYEIYENVIDTVMPIYRGEEDDVTNGVTMYFSPKSMSKEKPIPDWNFEELEELFIEGLDPNSYRMFIYKDECIE